MLKIILKALRFCGLFEAKKKFLSFIFSFVTQLAAVSTTGKLRANKSNEKALMVG